MRKSKKNSYKLIESVRINKDFVSRLGRMDKYEEKTIIKQIYTRSN